MLKVFKHCVHVVASHMPPVAERKSLTSRTVVTLYNSPPVQALARQPYRNPSQVWSMALGGIAMCESGVHMARKHLEWSNSKPFQRLLRSWESVGEAHALGGALVFSLY
jgi:hypothetical protein